MTRPWGHMGYAMIENNNRQTNNSILSARQEYAFKAAVLILCAGILAMVRTALPGKPASDGRAAGKL